MSELETQVREAMNFVWAEWLEHVAACTLDCRTRGVDCDESADLRTQYRIARKALLALTMTSNATR